MSADALRVSSPAPSRKLLGFSSLFAELIGVIVAQLGIVSLMQGVGIGGWGFFVAFKVPGYPVIPLLALASMAYVALNCSPAPEMTGQIVAYTGIVLATSGVVGALWVKLVMKRGLFAATTPAGLAVSMDRSKT